MCQTLFMTGDDASRPDTDFSGREGERELGPRVIDPAFWGAGGVVSGRHWLWISSAGIGGAGALLCLLLPVFSLD